MLTGPAPGCRLGRAVGDPSKAATAVDALAAAGAECLAVHRSLAAAALPALRAAATAHRLPLVGDLPPGATAADAGYASVDLLSATAPLPPAARAADWLRAWAASTPETGGALARSLAGQPTTITISPTRWQWQTSLPSPALDQIPFVSLLSRLERDWRWPPEAARAALPPAEVNAALAAMHGAIRQLHDAGVPLALGSGTPSPYVAPGGGVWSEMGHLAASLGPEAAWVAATRTAGAALGIPQLGVLEPGAPADLLLFRRDPTDDLSALTTLDAVVSQGRLYPARRLSGDRLEATRYAQHPLHERLSMLAVRVLDWWHGGEEECAPM